MEVQIVLWRELPEGVAPLPRTRNGGWVPHPPHVYRWRWLVVDANSDKRHAAGVEKTHTEAAIAARRFVQQAGMKIISRGG